LYGGGIRTITFSSKKPLIVNYKEVGTMPVRLVQNPVLNNGPGNSRLGHCCRRRPPAWKLLQFHQFALS
jgi:hypothetical protein